MQRIDQDAARAWLRDLFTWREKTSGLIAPDERLPWGSTFAMGIQHVLAMFGSTVVAPIIMGFNPNLAIFFSGIGTLLFFFITGGRIPSYLGSSFAFIAPVAAVTGSVALKTFNPDDVPKALGGIIVAGLIYTIIGFIVHYTGSGWIDALMPPVVTGAVVAIIGLNLAGAARGLAEQDYFLAILTILGIFAVATFGKGLLGRLPILIGTVFGYLGALFLGGAWSVGPDAAGVVPSVGRDIAGMHVSGVNLYEVKSASWFGFPDFQGPSFNGNAISLIAPVALVLVAENTGHIKAVSAMTRRNLMPWLGRGFIGDGVATMVAGAGGGTGVTTYAENIGVMAVTRVYSTAIFIIASGVALILGMSPKFGALINSIPAGVLGGVSTVLFGLIAATGARIWIENRVDFSKSVNLFVVAVTLIVGAANFTIHVGSFALEGIALGTIGSIVLYQIFRMAPGALDDDAATPASAGEPPLKVTNGRAERRGAPSGRRPAPQRATPRGTLPDLPGDAPRDKR